MGKSKDLASGNSAAYVETAGDTMSGALTINTANSGVPVINLQHSNGGADNFKIMAGTTGVSNGGFSIRDIDASANRFIIDGSGHVTMPNQPSFYAYFTSGTQFAGSGSTQKLTNFTEYNDTGSCWDQTNQRFTAPAAGKYFFALTGSSAYSSGYFFSKLTTNGSTSAVAGAFHYPTQSSGYTPFTITLVISLSANDYVEVMRDNNYQVTMYNTNFSGYLIG